MPLLDPDLVSFLEQLQREGFFAAGFLIRVRPAAPLINLDRSNFLEGLLTMRNAYCPKLQKVPKGQCAHDPS